MNILGYPRTIQTWDMRYLALTISWDVLEYPKDILGCIRISQDK